MLTPSEMERYSRQLAIPEIGEEGQEKLKKARVLVAGAGGLGSPASLYLAAAGIGTLRIVDQDMVSLNNLNRQILHWSSDIGKSKADSTAEKLTRLNPEIKIEPAAEKITGDNISQLIAGCDVIIDALDNMPARYLLNKAALEAAIPLCHGAVYGFAGRAMTVIPYRSACLMCVYKGATTAERVPVLGVTPAVIAAIQVTEAIKYITGTGTLLTDRILTYDGLDMEFSEIKVARDPDCEHCGKEWKI